MTFLTSCYTPLPVIRVKPEETKTTWDKGKEYVGYKKGDYEVYSSYNGNTEKYLIFDIEIVNTNGDDILVEPENFSMYTGNFDNQKQEISYSLIPIKAIDPELELLNIDLAYSKTEANRKNSQVVATAILGAAIPLSIVASIADGNNSNYVERPINQLNNSDLVDAGVNLALGATIVNDAVQSDKIISLNDEEYKWKETSLRKTTLSAGYSIRGLVYFPLPSTEIKKIRLDIPVGNDNVTIQYNITYYYPDNNNH